MLTKPDHNDICSRMREYRVTFALAVALMFFVAYLVVSFHHHPDGMEHADCAVCAVKYHHSTGTTFSVVLLILPTIFFPTLFASITPLVRPARHFSPIPSRAPPSMIQAAAIHI